MSTMYRDERVFGQEPERRGSNGLGIAGFVVSLLGLLGGCFGGVLLSPVGLVLSAFGMRREPRGLAIAGLIMGILGSLWLVVLVFVMGGVGVGVFAAVKEGIALKPVNDNIEAFYKAEGHVPADMAELLAKYPSTPTTTSRGAAFKYVAKPPAAYMIVTPGRDGVMGTADDWELETDLSSGSASPKFRQGGSGSGTPTGP